MNILQENCARIGTFKLSDVFDAGTLLLKNIHAEIKFFVFIALYSYLTTPANFAFIFIFR